MWEVVPRYRSDIVFLQQDIRTAMPDGPFDLVLCRNLVFTYFDAETQPVLLRALAGRMRSGACLVIGAGEALPEPHPGFVPWNGPAPVYRFSPAS